LLRSPGLSTGPRTFLEIPTTFELSIIDLRSETLSTLELVSTRSCPGGSGNDVATSTLISTPAPRSSTT
jgi:hypothetical protein